MNSSGTLIFVLGLAAVTATASCSSDPDPVLCTGELRHSVTVQITDSQGDTISSGAALRYRVDEESPIPCERNRDVFHCGSEESGDFVITATRGDQIAVGMIEVPADECHVVTQKLELSLSAE